MKRKFFTIITALFLCGTLFAQEQKFDNYYGPDFDYHQWLGPMIAIGRVYFDDVLQNSAAIEVADFVGEELRGRQFLIEPYPGPLPGEYFIYLPCYFDSPGETFTFKAYDHNTGIEYDLCTTTFEGSPLEVIGCEDGYGNPDYPVIFNFTRTEVPTYGPEYPWIPTHAYGGNGMGVVAQIQINGQLLDRGTYEVGAFCGDECRGNSKGDDDMPLVDFTEWGLGYFAFFNIMGNDGDIINFYLYDMENSSIFEGTCFTTVTLQNDGELGYDIFGGDIFVLNFVTEQTFTKEILGYDEVGGGSGYYYLLASPIGEVSPEDVTNMLENSYDLYYYDQTQELEWINYKGDANLGQMGGFNLEPLKGYLYANSQTVTLTFRGYAYSGDAEVTLVKDAFHLDLDGWNLVGNPFAETAYIAKPYYTMNAAGSELIAREGGIETMEGVFVIADADGETLTFSTEEPGKGNQQLVINLNGSHRNSVIDRAMVRFGDANTLPKLQLFENNTKVYIPQNGRDYAVVACEEMGEIPVNFKAAENGAYSLSFAAEEVSFNYLHLIDNMTGADVDLLATPNYSFNASTTDYVSRFKLVFATGNASDDNFSFYSNGNWIINNDGEAVLQVVDVTGRILSNEVINGSYSKAISAAPGVYMLRLIKGDDVKVQKIVLK